MKSLLLTFAFVALLIGCQQSNKNEYFGQTPPGNSPELFAPGIISLEGSNESMITFSPDGKQCYLTEHHKAWHWCKIKQFVLADTGWSTPQNPKFSNDYSMCPSISADGSKLFFASGRDSSMSVYECNKKGENWSEPVLMNAEISSESAEYSCHPSSLGSMFVCSWRAGAVGGCDGYRIPSINGEYQKAENMGLLNSIVGDCVWAPGPNEEYLIFQSRRPAYSNKGGFFETDLFITFALPNGEWSNPKSLGPEINSSATDGFAWVSHDGKYLFFSSDRRGDFDIYWVGLDSILNNSPKEPLVAVNHKPGDFEFYQHYKTVNDDTTTVYFDLIKAGNTKLILCNRANEELDVILEETRKKGKNEFTWHGEGYEKGEYLFKLLVSDLESEEVFMESTIQILLR